MQLPDYAHKYFSDHELGVSEPALYACDELPAWKTSKPILSIGAYSSPKCNCACLRLADTNRKNASHSSPDSHWHSVQQPTSPHPPALDEMKPASSACPTIPPAPLPRTDRCTAETFDHIPPRSGPLPPASTGFRSIPNKPLRIASSGSPIASPSVSFVISSGDHRSEERRVGK